MTRLSVNYLRPGQQGFTLVELIIGLTLTVVIVTALFSGLRLAARVWEKQSTQSEQVNGTRLARDWLRRYLAQAHPIVIEEQPGEPAIAFAGAGDYMRFVAPLPAHLGGGGLDWITLSILDQDGHRQLVVEHQLFHPEPLQTNADPQGERRVLLDELADARFAFYGAQEPEDPPAWHDYWNDAQALPTRIAVLVEFSDQRQSWPRLIVVPMVDGDLRETSPLISQATTK